MALSDVLGRQQCHPAHPRCAQSWLRMRNRDGRYSLMFEEWVAEDPFIISPRIAFEVGGGWLEGRFAVVLSVGRLLTKGALIVEAAYRARS